MFERFASRGDGLRYRRRKRLQACHQLERQIAELRARIKAETQFNWKEELNMTIKSPQDRLTHDVVML